MNTRHWQLFDAIDILYIAMEWSYIKRRLADPSSKDVMLSKQMMAYLEEKKMIHNCTSMQA